MSDHSFTSGTRTGTACGTLLVILSSIQWVDILQTTIVAAIGASVSFIITLIMKRLFRKWRK